MKKNFLKIHPLSILFLFLAFITGYFQYVFYLMSLIFIHELGHVSAGVFFGWKVSKVILLPFGGMTVFEEKINCPIKQEFVVAFMGPIYQILFYHLLVLLGFETDLLTSIHITLLIFNLLPIYPLDGSKILSLFFQKFFSFYQSMTFLFYGSFVVLLFLLFFHHTLMELILFFFLIYQVFLFRKEKEKLFYRFLLERYLYVFSFSKEKVVSCLKKMKKDTYHHFFKNGKIVSEKDALTIYFKGKNGT